MKKSTENKGVQTSEPIRDKKEIEAIKNYLKGKSIRNFTMLVTGLNSALRISDILRLKWSDVLDDDFKTKEHIKIVEKKTKKLKSFPINKSLKTALQDFLKTKPDAQLSDYIFQSREGINKKLTNQMVWEIFKDIKTNLKISSNFSSHTMRKTFCYHANKNGASLEELMVLLNHVNIKITKVYLGLNQDDINSVYLKTNL